MEEIVLFTMGALLLGVVITQVVKTCAEGICETEDGNDDEE